MPPFSGLRDTNAKSGKELSFPPKTFSRVIFAVDTVSEGTVHAGPAEMAVFKD